MFDTNNVTKELIFLTDFLYPNGTELNLSTYIVLSFSWVLFGGNNI